jgi:hypothetical protein
LHRARVADTKLRMEPDVSRGIRPKLCTTRWYNFYC